MNRRDLLKATGVGLSVDLGSLLDAAIASPTENAPTTGESWRALVTSLEPNDFGGRTGFAAAHSPCPADGQRSGDGILQGATTLGTVFGALATVSVPYAGDGRQESVPTPDVDILRSRGYERAGRTAYGPVFAKRRRTRATVVMSTPNGPLLGYGPAFGPVRAAAVRVAAARASTSARSIVWRQRVAALFDALGEGVYRSVEPVPTADRSTDGVGPDTALRGQAVSIDNDALRVRDVVDRPSDDPRSAEDGRNDGPPGSLLAALPAEASCRVRSSRDHVIYEGTVSRRRLD